MTLWHPDPPQGFGTEQELIIIGRPVIPRFDSPAGLTPTGLGAAWINDLNDEFNDDLGNVIVFLT